MTLQPTTRPGAWGDPIAFDAALSLDTLAQINRFMLACDNDTHHRIVKVAIGQEDPYYASGCLRAMLGSGHALFDRVVDAANSEPSFHTGLMPALLVWSLNQPWSQHYEMTSIVSSHIKGCLGVLSSRSAITAANLFMAQLLPLVSLLPRETTAPLVAHLLGTLYTYGTPWKQPPGAPLSAHYLELSHGLIQMSPSEANALDTRLQKNWRKKAVLTLEETPTGMLNELCVALINSTIPPQYLHKVFRDAGPSIWSNTRVSSFLVPELPSSEAERFALLPLATRDMDAVPMNRLLLQLYCPRTYPLIDLATTDETNWLNPLELAKWFNEPQQMEHCPLPGGLFENTQPDSFQ